MFCVNCGNRLPDNAKFCNQCGKAVSGAAPVAPVVPPPVEPAKAQEPIAPPAVPKQKKPASAGKFIALLLVGLLLLAAGGYAAYRVYGNVMVGNPPFENFFGGSQMNNDQKEEPDGQNGNEGDRNPSDPSGNTQTNPGTTSRPNDPTVPTVQQPVATEAPDTYIDTLAGLSYILTGDMVRDYSSDAYCEYSGDHFEVYISTGTMEEVSDEAISTSREFAKFYAELYDMSANSVKNENGVYYVEVEDEASIMGFYTDGKMGWTIVCKGDLTYRDVMIFIATSGWIN